MKKTSFTKRIISGFGMLIVSDITCFVLMMVTMNFFEHIFVKVLVGIVSMAILGLTMFSYAYNLGEQDKKLEKRGNTIDLNMSKKLGIIDSIPLILFLMVLIVSKMGLIMDILPYYKLTNAFFLPFIQIITSGEVAVSSFPIYGFLILFVLIFIVPIAIYIGYDLGYKQIDLTLKIFYKKKS